VHQFAIPKRAIKPVSIWLLVIVFSLLAIIVLGGLTRLTDSGLSITEWKPITGILPPLSLLDWQSEFQKYQQIPEFKLQNASMTLAEFQTIYWWEWGHRVLGRVIGLAVFVPLVIFWTMGFLSKGLKIRLSILFVLGGLQGFIGWWMVSSGLGGLGDTLDVSPYRLVIHLGLALFILGMTAWTFFDVALSERRRSWRAKVRSYRAVWVLLVLVYIQFLLGGFVAGNDGGMVANTWPLIEGGLAPASYGDLVPFWRNWFETPVVTQFHHRLGAYLVLGMGLWVAFTISREKIPELRQMGRAVILILMAQMVLGIWTLLAVSPLELAIAHQFVALLTFLIVLNLTHASSRFYLSS